MMSARRTWLPRGAAIALDDGGRQVSFDGLHARIDETAGALRATGLTRIASLADNGIDWLVADLAMLEAGIVHVPLPGFFTPAQLAGALAAAGVESVLSDPATPLDPLSAVAGGSHPVGGLEHLRLSRLSPDTAPPALPAGTVKITFTSGSTGAPKGVCLGGSGLLRVVAGVQEATRSLAIGAHLCALPLAVLLENVAGAMVALAQGATVHLRPAEALGWRGAAGFDAARLDHQVRQAGAESLILMPKMLQAWTARLMQGSAAPSSLKLVAVGGAAVGGATITAARAAGLPAFEGYGLSEGGSVQALNLPGADRAGSVGRALPHARIRVDEHGELHVGGALMLGYVGRTIDQDAELATGDIGHIDAEGFVWIRGRRDNLIITGLGRNVSPEWVESMLREAREIVEAVVLPDGTGGLRAVLWPAADASDEALQAAVDRANFELPDYARATHWMRARRAFDAASGLTTPGGKPLRAAIAAAHPETDQPTRQETHA